MLRSVLRSSRSVDLRSLTSTSAQLCFGRGYATAGSDAALSPQSDPTQSAPAEAGQGAPAPATTSKQQRGVAARRPDATGLQPLRRMTDYMTAMQRDMDSLMNAFMPGVPSLFNDPFFRRPFDVLSAVPAFDVDIPSAVRSLALEVEETDDEYKLTAMVPGFSKEEIKVTLGPNQVLTVRGEHKDDKEQRFESFVRRVALPDGVDPAGISAKTEHGVLNIKIPKATPKQAESKEIPIA